jgi:hypothetical protein
MEWKILHEENGNDDKIVVTEYLEKDGFYFYISQTILLDDFSKVYTVVRIDTSPDNFSNRTERVELFRAKTKEEAAKKAERYVEDFNWYRADPKKKVALRLW